MAPSSPSVLASLTPMAGQESVTVSFVVPVHDEAENLTPLYARVASLMEREGTSFELLFVDDGSRDTSLEIMQALRAYDPRVSVLRLSRNFGHQVAITAGMEHARGEAIVVMDADLQDPPEVVPEMLAKWRSGHDVVYGVRSRRHGESVFKRATASAFYRVIRAITSVELPLDAGDFRLISRRVVEALRRLPERQRYVRGLVAWVGYSSAPVEYERDARHAGTTKFSLRKMVRFGLDGVVSFSAAPLWLATWTGCATSLGALLAALWLAASSRSAAEGEATLIAIALMGGLQLVALGVIGEYLARIWEEAKGRPLYLVDRLLQGPDEKVRDRGEGAEPALPSPFTPAVGAAPLRSAR